MGLMEETEPQLCQSILCKVWAKLSAADLLANAQWILETAKPFVLFQCHKSIPARGLMLCSPFSTTHPASPTMLVALMPEVLKSNVAADLHGDATASHEDTRPWDLALA